MSEAQRFFDDYAAAVNSGNLDAWVGSFAGDVVMNPPDRGAVKGRDAIRAYGEEAWFGPYTMHHAVRVDEAIPMDDDHVHTRGTWTIDLTPKDGSAASSIKGTFMWLLRKEAGSLKGARVAFSILD